MSENNKKQNLAPLISTIVVAVLAAAAVVALIFILNGNQEDKKTIIPESFRPSAELEQECENAAHGLVSGNYEIVRLFLTQGLPHLDEPYGNAPEDGIFTVDTERSGSYKTLEDIENKVKTIYTDEAADKILHNLDGNGFEVYKNRKILVDNPSTGESAPRYKEATVLGINADFKTDLSLDKLWQSCSLSVLPTSETECEITIYLGGAEPSSDSSGASSANGRVLHTKMTKSDAGWRLTEFVYC